MLNVDLVNHHLECCQKCVNWRTALCGNAYVDRGVTNQSQFNTGAKQPKQENNNVLQSLDANSWSANHTMNSEGLFTLDLFPRIEIVLIKHVDTNEL